MNELVKFINELKNIRYDVNRVPVISLKGIIND